MNANLSERMRENLMSIGEKLRKHSPQINAVTVIFLSGLAVYEAVKATPKVHEELETKKKELNTEKLPVKEQTIIYAKHYWKSAVPFGISSFLTVKSADKQYKLQNYAVELATDYSLAKAALREYKAQVAETIGEKKAEKIQYAVDQKDLDNHPPVEGVNIYMPAEDGIHRALMYEPLSNHYFWDVPDNFDAYVGRAQRIMSEQTFGELTAYEWLQLLPKEVLDSFPDGEADRLMHKVWTRDTPYEGFNAYLGDTFTVHDGGKWDGYPCRRIVYDDDPVPSY